MRYVQLRAFHFVATTGGFSRAAEALHLTQPAVSDQVRRLEEDYDVLLFDRRKKQVVVTPQGEALLTITRRLFDAERQAAELLSEARALRAGRLRIMADAAHHLLHILARFRERYPGVRVTVSSGNSETVLTALEQYDADIGVMGEAPEARGFDVMRLNSSPIVGFAAKSADFPAPPLTLSDLAGLPLVFREEGSKTRTKLSRAARAEGVRLKPSIEAEGREAVREIVAAGGGIGFVSEAEFGQDQRLVAIPLKTREPLVMEESLICLSDRRQSKLIQAFFEMAGI